MTNPTWCLNMFTITTLALRFSKFGFKTPNAYNAPHGYSRTSAMKLLMFTKMLKSIGRLSLSEAGDCIAGMGFDGADLVVRSDGHVLPEEAALKLPEAIDMLKSKGLTVPMITTSITKSYADKAEEIFAAASRSGVQFIKLGYWEYSGFGRIENQIQMARQQLKGIEKLSRDYGITAAIHTHSGAVLSANPAIVLMLLQEHDPQNVCAYIDPGHILIQGGPAGLEMGIDILSRYIRLVAVKNFWHFGAVDERTGKWKWQRRVLPLREELVPWPQIFKDLKGLGFDGNISVHSEYDGFTFEDLIKQTKDDLAYLKEVLDDRAFQ